jgi:hypothetical protein
MARPSRLTHSLADGATGGPSARAAGSQRKRPRRRVPAAHRGSDARTAGSRQPENGCSTTSISSKSRSARRGGICQRATAGNCRVWRVGRRLTVRASMTWPSRPSRMAMVGSTRKRSVALSPPTRPSLPLNLGELWAVPIMLRLALIENLRRVGVRIARAWDGRNLADSWADRMTETAEQDPKSLILVIADMARSNPPMVGAFVAELARRLQGRGPALALPLTWVEQRLSESALTVEQLVQWENQQQASDQVSISNSIGSLRLLGALDWREFVETMSVVEQSATRGSGWRLWPDGFCQPRSLSPCHRGDRQEVPPGGRRGGAQGRATGACGRRAEHGPGRRCGRTGHVGFYLIDKGLPELLKLAGLRLSGAAAWRRTAGQFPLLPVPGRDRPGHRDPQRGSARARATRRDAGRGGAPGWPSLSCRSASSCCSASVNWPWP